MHMGRGRQPGAAGKRDTPEGKEEDPTTTKGNSPSPTEDAHPASRDAARNPPRLHSNNSAHKTKTVKLKTRSTPTHNPNAEIDKTNAPTPTPTPTPAPASQPAAYQQIPHRSASSSLTQLPAHACCLLVACCSYNTIMIVWPINPSPSAIAPHKPSKKCECVRFAA